MSALTPEFLALQSALAGEYSLQRELGRGGMGVVYLARDVQLDRDVAIKVLPSHLSVKPESRERFLREARTAAGLSHPNIVPIHRVGESRGFVFFVMAYVPGQTLGERLRASGPVPPAEAMRLLREVAWALEYAHERGIIHRDVKPDNILIEEGSGRALVTDFGIARNAMATSEMNTDPGRIMGTAHFMSPEQAACGDVDARSDLYSLAVVGYLAVSGRLPFESSSLPALLVQQATGVPAPLAHIAPGVPAELAAVIDRCLATRRENRLASGKAIADALQVRAHADRSLPPELRNWLRLTNPAQPVFIAMYAFGALAGIRAAMFAVMFNAHPDGDFALAALLVAAPLLPTIGFHLTQARRLFRTGYSLADLREAIARDDRERVAAVAIPEQRVLTVPQWYLRLVTFGSAAQSAIAATMMMAGVGQLHAGLVSVSVLGTLATLALCNAFDVPLLPTALRRGPRSLRNRLWTSRAGGWLAKLLKAPPMSAPIGGAIFRPTEVALGVAADELFAALPAAIREYLADLPAIVADLEVRAAAARARVDGRIPAGSEARRALAEAVAALENIRLDLLRLHAGEADLAPITTLLDAARVVGVDVERLIVAQREVAVVRKVERPHGARRTPTPV